MENQQGRGGNADDSIRNAASADNDLPGYPHYSADEDITAAGERVSADVEGISRANNQTGASLSGASDTGGADHRAQYDAGNPVSNPQQSPRSGADTETTLDPDTDVTEEELMLLDQAERGIDESDDAQAPIRAHLDETDDDGDPLNESAGREGSLGADIDIPGMEENVKTDAMGQGDEENDYYSLGSDDNDSVRDPNEGSINNI
jgi:hypothetical protein